MLVPRAALALEPWTGARLDLNGHTILGTAEVGDGAGILVRGAEALPVVLPSERWANRRRQPPSRRNAADPGEVRAYRPVVLQCQGSDGRL